MALTLRAVGGLTTAEVARALLVPEPAVGQRISRAKRTIKASGAEFRLPPPAERAERLAAVERVLYLIFNEGYTATSGPVLVRVDLTSEAIRLTRQLYALMPDDAEVAGLLALMLLTDARRAARTDADGALVPLAEQDRSLWDAEAIAEGLALVTRALSGAPLGPYQLQAAIAAVHDEAVRAEDTDWPQILGLYGLLETLAPGPMVTLNRIVAVAMVHGAQPRSSSSPAPASTPPSPATTASTPSAATCSRWRATRPPPPRPTPPPRGARSASQNGATSRPAPWSVREAGVPRPRLRPAALVAPPRDRHRPAVDSFWGVQAGHEGSPMRNPWR